MKPIDKLLRRLIDEVTRNSPAEEAGLRKGDVIVDFNDKTVTDRRNLRLMAAQARPVLRCASKSFVKAKS